MNTNIEQAISHLQNGKGIIVTDSEDRENEGDIFYSAQYLTEQQMALLIRECSGIVCLCLTEEKAQALNLPYMVEKNTSHYQTAFTITIEAAQGVTTGVSAKDRVQTIKTAIASDCKPEDLNRPGHVFPLIAKNGGVMERPGHTEACVDLMKMAELEPYGVLCEITNPDGTMAKSDQITAFAEKHNMPIVTIENLKQGIRSYN